MKVFAHWHARATDTDDATPRGGEGTKKAFDGMTLDVEWTPHM